MYPCQSVVVAMQANNGQQQFFIGHTDKVNPLYSESTIYLLCICHLTHSSSTNCLFCRNSVRKWEMNFPLKVSCISLNCSSSLLASGQTGPQSVVRIWKFQSGECLAMFKTHAHSLHSLSFAQNGMYIIKIFHARIEYFCTFVSRK